MEKKKIITGYAIVIADRGWVYVGQIEIDGIICHISNCKNIRRWGTKNGLGEIAKSGPTEKTIYDEYGDVYVPVNNCQLIETRGDLWK